MFIAEREGFEPPVPLSTTVFKTVVIDHSTISPFVGKTSFVFKSGAKVVRNFHTAKFFAIFLHLCRISLSKAARFAYVRLPPCFRMFFGRSRNVLISSAL